MLTLLFGFLRPAAFWVRSPSQADLCPLLCQPSIEKSGSDDRQPTQPPVFCVTDQASQLVLAVVMLFHRRRQAPTAPEPTTIWLAIEGPCA